MDNNRSYILGGIENLENWVFRVEERKKIERLSHMFFGFTEVEPKKMQPINIDIIAFTEFIMQISESEFTNNINKMVNLRKLEEITTMVLSVKYLGDNLRKLITKSGTFLVVVKKTTKKIQIDKKICIGILVGPIKKNGFFKGIFVDFVKQDQNQNLQINVLRILSQFQLFQIKQKYKFWFEMKIEDDEDDEIKRMLGTNIFYVPDFTLLRDGF